MTDIVTQLCQLADDLEVVVLSSKHTDSAAARANSDIALIRQAADEIEQLRMALKTLIDFYDDGEIPTAQVLARAEALLP